MNLSPTVVLLALLAVVEFCLGALMVVSALRARRAADGPGGSGGPRPPGDSAPLLSLTAGRLVAVAIASAVLLLLVLSSEVPEWPGLICIQGVLRLGLREAVGGDAAAFLPYTLAATAILKPLLILTTGGALTIQAVDRATRTGPLAGRAVLWMAAAGLLAMVDASAYGAYLAIPRGGRDLADGCCMVATGGGAPAVSGDGARLAFVGAFAALSAATVAASIWFRLALARPTASGAVSHLTVSLTALALLAVATVGSGVYFVQNALAPAFLRLPLHECVFCVVRDAPELWLGLTALAGGGASAVWASVAARCGTAVGAGQVAAERSRRLLGAAALLVASGAILMFVEYAIARCRS